MTNPYKSTYTTSYRPPSAYDHGNVLGEVQGVAPPAATATNRNFNETKLNESHVSSPVKRRSNESQILGSTGSSFKQPPSAFKTEYIRSYSPPREKSGESGSPKLKTRTSPKNKTFSTISSFSSPGQTSSTNNEKVTTPVSNNNNNDFYDPASISVGTPVGQDAGNANNFNNTTGSDFNTTANSGQYSPNKSRILKPPFITEYNRAYSPPRDKVHSDPDDLEGTGEKAYSQQRLVKGEHHPGGAPAHTQTLEQGNDTSGTRSSGDGISGGDSSSSPYYKTEYVRQYSPPRSKKVKVKGDSEQ